MLKKIISIGLIVILSGCVSNNQSKNGSDSSVDLNYISSLYAQKDYQAVISNLNRYAPENKQAGSAKKYLYGLSYLKMNLNQLALDYFAQVLEIYPNHYEILNNMGVAYFHLNNFKHALKYFELSFNANTNFSIAADNYKLTRPFTEKVQGSPEMVKILRFGEINDLNDSLGWFFYYYGDFQKAIYYFKRAVEEDPKLISGYIALGYVYDVAKNFKTALEYFEKASLIDDKSPDLMNNLGIVYYHLKDFGKAETSFKKAIDMNGSFAEPYNNLGYLYLDLGKISESQGSFEKSIQLNKLNIALLSESIAGLSFVDFKAGKNSEAKIKKSQALKMNYKLGQLDYLENFLQWSPSLIEIWKGL